jgi:lactate dehydrogenase-like 2-hydroxyacid dehydrogenase
LIGEYKPLSVSLANTLKIKIPQDEDENIEEKVLEKLGRIIKKNTKAKIATVLLLDEFGKFLEYAVKNNPDKEVYFIQQLAEFFNDPKKLALSISSLHQNFSSYGQSLNKEQFNIMKQGVVIINTSRGGLINSENLLEALDSGKIDFAGLDVFEKEKFDCANPDSVSRKLMTHKKVVATPHSAFYTVEAVYSLFDESI